MSDEKKNIYEGLFLFPQAAATNLKAAVEHVEELLSRAGAEVQSFRKWDERRLAYEIKGNKRGVYFLVYFRCDPTKLVGLERDCNLSEQMLRALVTRADHLPAETIEAADGRSQLADEMKFRSEQEKAAAEAPAPEAPGAPDDSASPAEPAGDAEPAAAAAQAEPATSEPTEA